MATEISILPETKILVIAIKYVTSSYYRKPYVNTTSVIGELTD